MRRSGGEGLLTVSLRAHLTQHRRLYAALGLGLITYALTAFLAMPLRLIAAGDTFFAIYLALVAFVLGDSADALRRRANVEDEGIFLVILLVLAAISSCLGAIVVILHNSHGQMTLALVLALATAPLGWCTLHVVAAFHYADLYYRPGAADGGAQLIFPGGADPTAWDFVYYSFVVGMTAQVSDVQVVGPRMRRATLGHGVASFFFNTVLIAMAVNAVVTIAA